MTTILARNSVTKKSGTDVILNVVKNLEKPFGHQNFLQNDRNRTSGNAVIFILIAVVLFGGLAYTFMRGAKSGQGNLSSGQARLAAQEIINYAQSIEKAVNKLRAHGCSQDQLSFDYDIPGTTGYENASAPANESCHIFSANGGGVSWSLPSDQWIISTTDASTAWPGYPASVYKMWNIARTVCFTGFGIPCDGTAATKELVISLYFLPKNLCEEINRILGVPSITTLANLPRGAGDKYNGSFYSAGQYSSTPLNAAPAGCMLDNAPGSGYSFYLVIFQQ